MGFKLQLNIVWHKAKDKISLDSTQSTIPFVGILVVIPVLQANGFWRDQVAVKLPHVLTMSHSYIFLPVHQITQQFVFNAV